MIKKLFFYLYWCNFDVKFVDFFLNKLIIMGVIVLVMLFENSWFVIFFMGWYIRRKKILWKCVCVCIRKIFLDVY